MPHRTFRSKRDASDSGFSFIELLAYITIAALLILAAIPQLQSYREKAIVSNLQNDVHNASLQAEATNIDHGGDLTAIGEAVQVTKKSSGTTLVTVDLGGGEYRIMGVHPGTTRVVVYNSRTEEGQGPGLHILNPGSPNPEAPGDDACDVTKGARMLCDYMLARGTGVGLTYDVASAHHNALFNAGPGAPARPAAGLAAYDAYLPTYQAAKSAYTAAGGIVFMDMALSDEFNSNPPPSALVSDFMTVFSNPDPNAYVFNGEFDDAKYRADLLPTADAMASLVAEFRAGRVE